jgi:amino acid adenylation domain-containing protein
MDQKSTLLERRSGLSPAKRLLLEQRLKGITTLHPASATIPRRPEQNSHPLSFAQERMWFLAQLEPDSPAYNRPLVLHLKGSLNIGVLAQSLSEVLRQHEVLRATFTAGEGQPIQFINPVRPINLPIVDLSELPPTQREGQARRLAAEEAQRPFDLKQGPLLRATLLRLGQAEYVLILVIHHIAFDAWSARVFIRELSTLYQTLSTGDPSPLPELPIQYADFAHWQRAQLQGETLEAQLAYWKETLAGAAPSLDLPIDHPRPARMTYRGASRSLRLPASLVESVKSLSRQESATLFMTLLAAFQALLYRYTGQDDMVVGCPIAGRTRVETEGLIGLFINTLIIRVDLSGEPSFRELLGRVRKAALGAYAHQDLPFEKLVEALQLKRDMSRPPLFQVMFNLENMAEENFESPELSVTRFEFDSGLAAMDLNLEVVQEAEGLLCLLRYNTDLFEAATIERMLGHFQTLLEGVVANPEQSLSHLPCLSEAEQQQLLTKRSSSLPDQFDDVNNLTNLTTLQFQFWIGQKLQPETGLFNLIDTFVIAGPIQPEHFQKAFQALIHQTDSLRTVIEEIEGIPQQRILDKLSYTMEYLDLSQEPAPQLSFQAWLQQRSQTPFDLEGRLFEAALLKVSEDQFIWYLSIHHIISDGWSFYLIFQRMQEFYRRSLEGRLDQPVTSPSFQAFADEDAAYRRSSHYFSDKAYWEKKLAYQAQPLTFYGRTPARQPASVRRIDCELGIERTQKLKARAQQARFVGKTMNVTLFNILLGVFSAYLYRVTGNDEFLIGTPFLNRPSAVFKETVGLFMQVAPLRIKISENDTFAALIEKVQAESAETSQHYRYTLRNHQNSLYDVIFNYHNVSFSRFNGMPAQEKWLHSGNDGHSLSLHVRYPEAESLLLQFDFHPDVFDEEQQARAVEHFLHLLDAFLEDPEQPFSRANMLSIAEKQRLLVEFNQTETTFSEGLCIQQLFEAQAEYTPDALAVISPAEDAQSGRDQHLTYRELNRRANQLAHYLKKRGVGPEVLVGLCVERSLEMLVGMWGILKAGGAYIPLDPNYPQERLAFIIKDTQMPVLLTQQNLLKAAPPECGAHIICLDAEWPAISQEPVVNPRQEVGAGNLAYVIYTSGSTGKPKGVMIEHRALVNYTEAARAEFKLKLNERVLQFASISFDASAEEIYPCLTSGATLVLRTDSMLNSAQRFLEMCRAWRLTLLDLPTAYWHELTTALEVEQLSLPASIRLVIIGGEKALPEQLNRWQRCVGRGVRLLNTYGPTETTVVATAWELAEPVEVERGWTAAPIGRPIRNVQTYILDPYLQPVPLGLPGELYIGGAGLARGYLNQPELTAQKFIHSPFKNNDELGMMNPQGKCDESKPFHSSLLYKSGDLVRYQLDGTIEFLGRTDHQVKIRGFRIELGEIEAALGQHPAVSDNVVVVREDEPGDKRLVAYFRPKQADVPTNSELRNYLKNKLPDYMLPSLFVALESLPLTPNGKVDRRALPKPEMSRAELDRNFVAPRTSVERQIAEIWGQLLKLERVGIYDNFFELGGHSLLATQVISRLCDTFKITLPLRSLFETSNLAVLAEGIEALRWSANIRQLELDTTVDERELGEL